MSIGEVKVPRIGVGVVVIKKGQILMGKRKGAHGEGEWAFPGGHLEFGEEVEACAVRELEEETGLKALSVRPGAWVNNIFHGKHYVTLFMFVEEFKGEAELKEPHKCEGWEWFNYEALPAPLFSTITSLIEKEGPEYLSGLKEPFTIEK